MDGRLKAQEISFIWVLNLPKDPVPEIENKYLGTKGGTPRGSPGGAQEVLGLGTQSPFQDQSGPQRASQKL